MKCILEGEIRHSLDDFLERNERPPAVNIHDIIEIISEVIDPWKMVLNLNCFYFERDNDVGRIIRIDFMMHDDGKNNLLFFYLSTLFCRLQIYLFYSFLEVKLIVDLFLSCIERVITHLHHECIVDVLSFTLFSTLKILHFSRFS